MRIKLLLFDQGTGKYNYISSNTDNLSEYNDTLGYPYNYKPIYPNYNISAKERDSLINEYTWIRFRTVLKKKRLFSVYYVEYIEQLKFPWLNDDIIKKALSIFHYNVQETQKKIKPHLFKKYIDFKDYFNYKTIKL